MDTDLTTVWKAYRHQHYVPNGERVPIGIDPLVRNALRDYLMHDREGTGEGYSAFILRAIDTFRALEAVIEPATTPAP